MSGQVEREASSFAPFVSNSCIHVIQNIRTGFAKTKRTSSLWQEDTWRTSTKYEEGMGEEEEEDEEEEEEEEEEKEEEEGEELVS